MITQFKLYENKKSNCYSYVYEALKKIYYDEKHNIVNNDREKIITQLNINNCDMNSSYKSLTILFVAVHYNNFEILEYLIKNGADINHISDWGDTPLTWFGTTVDVLKNLDTLRR